MTQRFLLLDNDPLPYAWGARGGISALRGIPVPEGAGAEPEAELWIGSHPRAPSRILDDDRWPDLHAWERDTGKNLPWLLKILHARSPLSLQVHPSAAQAARGFAAEEAAGVPRDAPHRNYPDPRAKPEMLLALRDGFEVLCGFRSVEDVIGLLDALALPPGPQSRWRRMLMESGPGGAVGWLLSGDIDVARLVDQLVRVSLPPTADPVDPVEAAGPDDRAEAGSSAEGVTAVRRVIGRLHSSYPADPGIAVAVMLHHLRLAAGEALWLPAGVPHAYLHGLGMELMGPSDNVLRGGLTGKHVDVPELLAVLDGTPGAPARLRRRRLGPGVAELRPQGGETVPDLRLIDGQLGEAGDGSGQTSVEIPTAGPAAVVVLEGDLWVGDGAGRLRRARHGDLLLHPEPGMLVVRGRGRFCAATGTGSGAGVGAG